MGNVVIDMSMSLVGSSQRRTTPPGKGSARTGCACTTGRSTIHRVFERVYGNLIEETGAVIMGRRSYDNSIDEWDGKGPMGDAVRASSSPIGRCRTRIRSSPSPTASSRPSRRPGRSPATNGSG